MEQKNFTNEIVFKKYKIKKILSTSKYSTVYEGINKANNTPIALKIEKDNHLKYLESEAYILIQLKGFGIPKFISYGKSGNYNILIEELLGANMETLWKKYGYKEDPFVKKNKNLKDLCLIAIQGLERLKYIHSKDILHRDLKHKNFIIGRNDPKNIYLIDFGFARKFRSSRTGKHIKYAYKHTLMGSLTFASFNAMKGYEQSRRDDLESFGYVLIYLAKGLWLPWKKSDISSKNEELKDRIKTITKMKMEISAENLCQGLPAEFSSYMKYVKHLEFEEDPNYDYLNNLFLSILSKNQFKNDQNFFWITKPKMKIIPKKNNSEKKEELNHTFKKLDKTQIRGSSKNRLYNSIKLSLNKIEKIKELKNKNLENESTQVQNNYTFLKNEVHPVLTIDVGLGNDSNIKKNLNFNDRKYDTIVYTPKINNFKEQYLKMKANNLKYVPKVFINNNIKKSVNNNSTNKINNYNKINNNINKKNNINKINNNNNFMNQTTNLKQNIKVYNEIKYKSLFFLNDPLKNTYLSNNFKKEIINYEMNSKKNNSYKRIITQKK